MNKLKIIVLYNYHVALTIFLEIFISLSITGQPLFENNLGAEQRPHRMINQSLPVGSISGNPEVTATGAAVYNIPIDVFDGYDNLKPNFSVSYNSQSGNGLLGYGWALSGVSMISRSSKKMYYDGEVSEPLLDNTDNMILDGQRLFLASGKNLVEGARYNLENDPSTDVLYTIKNGQSCFVVRTKDGKIKEYGNTSDSRVGGTPVIVWLLSSVEDTNGNKMYFSYECPIGTNEFYLSRVYYGRNRYVCVSLYYEDRPDKYFTYFAGRNQIMTKRLTSIDILRGNVSAWQYRFTYIYDGFYSKLTEVTKYGNDGVAHYNATKINYDGCVEGGESIINISKRRDKTVTIFSDFTGNGCSDFISCPSKESYTSSDYIVLYINRSATGGICFSKADSIRLSDGFRNVIIADVNGDGRKDMIVVKKTPNGSFRYDYYESDGERLLYKNRGFNDSGKVGLAGDFNGDGRDEILVKETQKIYDWQGNSIASGGIDDWGSEYIETYFPNNRFLGDFNGNGKINILCSNASGAWIYELTGDKFIRLSSFNTGDIHNRYYTYCGDFNGDGKTDLLCQNSNNYDDVTIAFSTGNNFVKKSIKNADIRSLVKVGDFNRDGKADIFHCEIINGRLVLKTGIFNGTNFIVSRAQSLLLKTTDVYKYYIYNDDTALPLIDYNGDGRTDLCFSVYSNSCIIKTFDDEQNHLVSFIDDGYGGSVSFGYRMMTDIPYDVSADNLVSFPIRGVLYPIPLVCELRQNTVDGISEKSYEYFCPRFHSHGRGFLGFGRIEVSDLARRIKTVSVYGINKSYYFPYMSSQSVNTFAGTGISKSIYNYTFMSFTGKRFLPYLSKKIENNILTGVISTTDIKLDGYGNMTEAVTEYNNGGIKVGAYVTYDNRRTDKSWISVPLSIEKITSKTNIVWKEKHKIEYDDCFRKIKVVDFTGDGTKQILENTYKYNKNGTVAEIGTKSYMSGDVLITKYSYLAGTGCEIEDFTDTRSLTIHYSYDIYGNIISEEREDGLTIEYEYDKFGRMVHSVSNDGTEMFRTLSWDNSVFGSVYNVSEKATGDRKSVV